MKHSKYQVWFQTIKHSMHKISLDKYLIFSNYSSSEDSLDDEEEQDELLLDDALEAMF